jgi:hypothetical protein
MRFAHSSVGCLLHSLRLLVLYHAQILGVSVDSPFSHLAWVQTGAALRCTLPCFPAPQLGFTPDGLVTGGLACTSPLQACTHAVHHLDVAVDADGLPAWLRMQHVCISTMHTCIVPSQKLLLSHRCPAARTADRNQGGVGDLAYPLVSDLKREITQKYNVLTADGVALRGLFIIDKEARPARTAPLRACMSSWCHAGALGRPIPAGVHVILTFMHAPWAVVMTQLCVGVLGRPVLLACADARAPCHICIMGGHARCTLSAGAA